MAASSGVAKLSNAKDAASVPYLAGPRAWAPTALKRKLEACQIMEPPSTSVAPLMTRFTLSVASRAGLRLRTSTPMATAFSSALDCWLISRPG